MDSEYSGVLNCLYCDICTQKIPNVLEAYKHECFDGIDVQNLMVEDNIIRQKEFPFFLQNNEESETLEYLDEDRELFINESAFMTSGMNLPSKNRICSSKNVQVHKTLSDENKRTLFSEDNRKEENLDPNREVLKIKKAIGNDSLRNADTKKIAKTQEYIPTQIQELCRSQCADEPKSSHDVDLDENGFAYSSERNLITMIEMVKKNQCLWNHFLPVGERNQYATPSAWTKIASHFPGWTPQIVRQQFSSLKSTFIRLNVMARSGSASSKKKPWPYDKYFEFLKDTMSPASTISNVPPPKPKKSIDQDRISENDGSLLEELGFEVNLDKKAVPQKKRKSIDPVERIILEKICNRENRNSRPTLDQRDQWGLWLSKELQNFPDPTDRLEIQAYITTYIAKTKRALKDSLAGDY